VPVQTGRVAAVIVRSAPNDPECSRQWVTRVVVAQNWFLSFVYAFLTDIVDVLLLCSVVHACMQLHSLSEC